MRLYTRTRLVLSCIVPCYLILGFLVSSFLAMWKSEIEGDLQVRAGLLAEEVAGLVTSQRVDNLEPQLRKRASSYGWVKQISILDSYGRVAASDGSPLAVEGILGYDVAQRRQITNSSEPLFFPESFEFFRPCAYGTRDYIIRVGVQPGAVARRIWWALRWFLPGWLIAGLMTLLVSLHLSRLTLERMVASMANQVTRVADGKTPDPLLVDEPAVEPLADGLRRLFRSIEVDRGRMGTLERNISESRDRATSSRQEAERLLHEKDRELALAREECRILWERAGSGILRLDPDGHILAANRSARHWLSLGPHPDPADLPRGLCQIIESANSSPGLTPCHGTVTARHPFFGHERRLDIACLPLGLEADSGGKPMLVVLEEFSGSKRAAEPDPTSSGGFLRLVKTSIVNIGQDLHALEGMRGSPERGRKHRQILCRMARLVRDLETLITSENMDEIADPGHNPSCPADQVAAAALQAARYAGVSAEFTIQPASDEGIPLEEISLALSSPLLDLILREAVAVVADLSTLPSLHISLQFQESTSELIISSPASGEEGGLFAQALSEYLAESRDMRPGTDLISLRIRMLQRIVERVGGRLDVSADKQGLTLSIPLTPESLWRQDSREPGHLARAFLS